MNILCICGWSVSDGWVVGRGRGMLLHVCSHDENIMNGTCIMSNARKQGWFRARVSPLRLAADDFVTTGRLHPSPTNTFQSTWFTVGRSLVNEIWA